MRHEAWQGDAVEGLPREDLASFGEPLSLVDVRAPRIELADGSSASLVDGRIELRDARGVLRVRFSGDEAEVVAPRDLTLRSEHGRVVIDAATDVVLSAARDITQRAGRTAELTTAGGQRLTLGPRLAALSARRLEVDAREGRLVVDVASTVARKLTVTAEELVEQAERVERVAGTFVTRARTSLTEIKELCESRLGRVRSLVRGTLELTTQRTALRSKAETSIDGERILLG
ncbi:MAG: DUF3540 domain-containing protein [Deltaproteobacteria bacterium]|nr:DUF3540 domain-containing protein [Deltaproteobacteria bacterium]